MSTRLGIESLVLMSSDVGSAVYGDALLPTPVPPKPEFITEHIPGTRGEIIKYLGYGSSGYVFRGRWITPNLAGLMNAIYSAIGLYGRLVVNGVFWDGNKRYCLAGIGSPDVKWSAANQAYFVELDLTFTEVV